MEKYSIGFFGDFTTGENYQLKSDRELRINVLRKYGYDWLFEDVKPLMERFSINIVNLETPLTKRTYSSLTNKKRVIHWADPDIMPKLLNKYNFKIVTLGNNHAMDYDINGLSDTIKALDAEGIGHFGAGLNYNEAKKPYHHKFSVGGKDVNLYFIGGYKYREDYDKVFNFYAAAPEKGGVNLLTNITAENIIKEIKEKDKDSFIIMFPHFGFDLLKRTDLQIEYSRGFIDAGADYVIGHGPHMMNSIEKYKDKTVVHGLGNFIFPTNFHNKIMPYDMVSELSFENVNGEIKVRQYFYPTSASSNSNEPKTRLIKDEKEVEKFVELLLEESNYKKEDLKIENVDGLIRIGI